MELASAVALRSREPSRSGQSRNRRNRLRAAELAALRASAYFSLGRSSEAHYIDEIGHGDDLTTRKILCVGITSPRENFAVWRLCAQLARVAREPFRRVNDELTAIEGAPAPRFNRILAYRDQCRPGLGKCQAAHTRDLNLR